MVKILYQCDICKSTHATREDAEKCESRGKPIPKFKLGDKVIASICGEPTFEAEIIWVGNDNHNRVWYNIRAFDRVRFVRGGGFTRDEDELIKV